MIEQLNMIAELWWNWMWPMLWQVSLLIVIIALIDLIIRKHVWPQVRYALWLLVLVKLVLPPSFSLPTGIVSHIRPLVEQSVQQPVDLEQLAPLLTEQTIGATTVKSPIPTETPIRSANTTRPSLSWHAIAMIAWMVTTLLLMLKLLGSHRRLRRVHCDKDSDHDNPQWLLLLLDATAEKLHLRQRPQLVLSSTVHCPAVLGLFRPVLLLPATRIETLSRQDVEHILLHELAHIKRRDLPVHALCVLLQIVYWFNPLLILVRRQLQRLREMCCDATVTGILKDKTDAYSQTILGTVEWLVNRPSYHGIGLLGLIEDPTHLRVRLEWLKKKPARHPSLRIITCLILVVTMATFILPMANAQSPDADNEPLAVETPATPSTVAAAALSPRSLHEAVVANDMETTRRFISQGADVNARDQNGMTALHLAAEKGHNEIVKLLIAQGADINAVEGERRARTPLHLAASKGHAEVVTALLARGADVNVVDGYGHTALVSAIYSGNGEEIVKLLIEGGIDVNKGAQNVPPLNCAIWGLSTDMVETLLDAGANTDVKDSRGLTPLHHAAIMDPRYNEKILEALLDKTEQPDTIYLAAYRGDLEAVKSYIAGGVDVNVKDSAGFKPLHWAVLQGSTALPEYLIAQGAEINDTAGTSVTPLYCANTMPVIKLLVSKGAAINTNGQNRLHKACRMGDMQAAKFLISKGADVNAIGSWGDTPLAQASRNGHTEVARFLLAEGADVNAKNDSGWTPLRRAIRMGHKATVELLIANGADTEASSSGITLLDDAKGWGNTEIINILRAHGVKETLHGAIRSGDIDEVKRLLAEGADINAKSTSGMTPLHWAAWLGYKPIVELLIAKGVDTDARTSSGLTPLDEAKLGENSEIVNILREHGAKDTLHGAASLGDIDEVKRLLAEGADINAKSTSGWTPLHSAAIRGHETVAELLLARGADIQAQNRLGSTPLSDAARAGYKDVVEFLLAKGADINAGPPLARAAAAGHKAIVELLLTRGADINVRFNGRTALELAKEENHADIVELLNQHGATE